MPGGYKALLNNKNVYWSGKSLVTNIQVETITDTSKLDSIELKKEIVSELAHGTIGRIYNATYKSIISRIKPDGYFPESLTGAYPGEFPRTIGGLVSLFLETHDYAHAQSTLSFVLETMKRNNLSKVPHVIGPYKKLPNGKFEQGLDITDQVDGRAFFVMAYARFCLATRQNKFENTYYGMMKKEMHSFLEQPYFYFSKGYESKGIDKVPYVFHPERSVWSTTGLKIVFNSALEHSREGRYWSVFDIMTQSVVGAAGEAMMKLANERGDKEFYNFLSERIGLLKVGIDRNMTRIVDGKKVYLEMRLPNGDFGKEFTGMGWLCYAPVAAQWEALDKQVLRNTIDLLKQKLYIQDPLDKNIRFTTSEYDEKGNITYGVIGKAMGWDIEYCRQHGQYDKILGWCKFLNKYHSDNNIYMEGITLKDGEWKKVDFGNGEQCTWWCWAIARLRKELKLPVLNP
ncbi:MAG: polymorphic toxin type 44 domain-containing protein [Bacteroidota bacterium]|nr:polymorphic toxin type 44 domain-containing protein [Bacteroidota bacterium]